MSQLINLHSYKLTVVFLSVFVFFTLSFAALEAAFDLSHTIQVQVTQLSTSFLAACFIILLLIADMLIPIPASIVMVTSGMLFGGFIGGIIALIGAVGGSVLAFYLSRNLGQHKIKKWSGEGEYQKLTIIMRKYGDLLIIITRMIPLAMESVNAIAGLSITSLKKFVLLNIVGFVPVVFLYTYSGSLFRNEPQNIMVILFIGFFTPVILWHIVSKKLLSKSKS